MSVKNKIFTLIIVSILVSPLLAHWDPEDGHKMHYPQLPDPKGWDVSFQQIAIADDFRCSESGPINEIHFWVSWKNDIVDDILEWYVVIHEDADGVPGQALWKYKSGDVALRDMAPEPQGWIDPLATSDDEIFTPENHTKATQVNITNIEDPLEQEEGKIYWLVIHAYLVMDQSADVRACVGWKTSLDHFRKPAMWIRRPFTSSVGWQPVPSPTQEQVDMAFVINGEDVQPLPMDFGDAPETKCDDTTGVKCHRYPTTLSRNGARHYIVPGVFLGSSMLTVIQIDAEKDGQPTLASDGDDANGIDDEQAVVLPNLLVPNTTATAEIVASTDGYIDAWIDFNGDGDWDDRGEKIFNSEPVVDGVNTLSFYVPSTTADVEAQQLSRKTYSRFRFSTTGDLNYYGPARDGEVEDYIVKIGPDPQPLLDYGDAPDNEDNPSGFATLLANNGARHKIDPDVKLGRFIDPEIDGQPNNAADGDDIASLDDEDGVSFAGPLIPGLETEIKVLASCDGLLYGWVDFNGSGSWESGQEQVFNAEPLAAGVNYLKILVPVTNQSDPYAAYARFRFITRQNAAGTSLSYKGLAEDGEVEDYLLRIVPRPRFDFGDAPELRCDDPDVVRCNTYPTTLARNGARHLVDPSIFLGNPYVDCIQIDAEMDGQPTLPADGDDNTDIDDEEGVQFLSPIVPGLPAKVSVWASVDGFVDAWIDFNHDGDWDDFGEQIFASEKVAQGNNGLIFNVPPYPHAIAANAKTYARFRYSTHGGLKYSGPARNGEVEDYLVKVEEPEKTSDLGDAPDSTNSFTIPMTAYRSLGPLDVAIKANYPTVYRIGSPPYGPIHWNPIVVATLGTKISCENEADYGYDEDPLNNLIPPLDRADLDSKTDDGIKLPLSLPHCNWTRFDYIVRVHHKLPRLYVNAWFDWNRDGDWDDTITSQTEFTVRHAKEWSVRNQVLTGLEEGVHRITSTPFIPWHPKLPDGEVAPIWMRITISEQPWEPGNADGTADAVGYAGSGPKKGYWIGETEDYFFVPDTECEKFADLNCDRQVDLRDLAVMASQWLLGTEQ